MNSQVGFKIGDRIIPRVLEGKREDELGDSAQAGIFRVVGASVRGRLHHHNDTPRDDAFAASLSGDWLAVAVADGAGSRTFSRHGASCLARRLCTRLLAATDIRVIPSNRDAIGKVSHGSFSHPDHLKASTKQQFEVLAANNNWSHTKEHHHLDNIMQQAFDQARNDLHSFTANLGRGLDDFHSTLLGLLLNRKTMEMGIGQIGDGLILGLDINKDAKLLAEPPTTDDPSASYFLTQDDWEQYLYTRAMSKEETEGFSTFYLMTDGVANDCQYGPPPDILKLWANDMDREIRLVPSLQITAERLKNYLANYKAQGSFDDRTLVVIFKDKVQQCQS